MNNLESPSNNNFQRNRADDLPEGIDYRSRLINVLNDRPIDSSDQENVELLEFHRRIRNIIEGRTNA